MNPLASRVYVYARAREIQFKIQQFNILLKQVALKIARVVVKKSQI